MAVRSPISNLATHEVTNQVPALEDYNAFEQDAVLVNALRHQGAEWAEEQARQFGAVVASGNTQDLARAANTCVPEFRPFDRFGRRIDEVEFHPAYHELMRLAIENQLPSIAWTAGRSGGHVAHSVLTYLFYQVEQGISCPLAMTYAAIPSLRHQPEIAEEWEPRLLATQYDARCIPAGEKSGAMMGMAMTEKQGGSDVRSNTTRAVPVGGGGPGGEYELTGHKWFCSAPMCDAFLTLAYTDKGLSCFLVPRWRPDDSRNPFFIQRLKDKLGDRSNASSEIEYQGTWARMVGEEGRGVRTIMDMVHHTRLECTVAPAALMRHALAQAIHHAAHRSTFGARLIEHDLMRNVLADLAIEWEAATTLAMRVARAFDESGDSESGAAFARLAVAVSKYWTNKRVSGHVAESMECLGGVGYVEESVMPRLYRQAPLNGIWEGSGNVICLDVLRTMAREPQGLEVLIQELGRARGSDARYDRALEGLESVLSRPGELEQQARRVVELMALVFQAALLIENAPEMVADAFCATRLGGDWGMSFGTLPGGTALDKIIDRARPALV